jgi:hypothetical protein
MKAEIKITIDGEEYVIDEYRLPEKGEYFIDCDGRVYQADTDFRYDTHTVLKPKAKYQDYTLELAQKHYRWGATIPARFRDGEDEEWEWEYGSFLKYDDCSDPPFYDVSDIAYKYCQILIPSDGGEK